MKGLWAGVMGLALMLPAGSVWAQDAGAPQVEPSQASEPASVPEQGAPEAAETAAQPSGESPQTVAGAPGWEGDVPAAYRGTRPGVSESVLEAWLARPRSLLDDNPRGGREMAQFTRSLAETDNRAILPLVDLVKMSDVRDAQVGAVADGLASAMRDAEVPAPRYAAFIQWAVAQSGSEELIEAFERSSGADEDRTAAIGAGGAAGGGGAGGGSLSGGGAPGTSGPVGGASTVATTGGLTGGRGGGGSVSLNESDRLLGAASGRVIVCTLDASPAGCQVVF